MHQTAEAQRQLDGLKSVFKKMMQRDLLRAFNNFTQVGWG